MSLISPQSHPSSLSASLPLRQRWLAMAVLCLATVMIVLDTTVVNVALPSIQQDLGFSNSGIAWVVNAYLITFGGFLLLGGRCADLYGQFRLFMAGLVAFTLTSLLCGIATNPLTLVVARTLQGIGGAVTNAVALMMVMNLFTEPAERTKAMGFYGFVAAGGGALGLVLGGVLTEYFGWHWVFLINLPIGGLVFILAWRWLPRDKNNQASDTKADALGAVLITSALIATVYTIINSHEVSGLTLAGLTGLSLALFAAFVWVETQSSNPLVPFDIFRQGSLVRTNLIGILWSICMFSWFFLAALFLRQIWNYSPLAVGLAFLPANLVMAAFSISLSARVVMRYGVRNSIVIGLSLTTLSLAWFGFSSVEESLWGHLIPSMFLLGLGCGIAMNPIMLAATDGISEANTGLVSGIISTSFMVGGALGLAVLATIVAAVSHSATVSGVVTEVSALAEGYRLAFFIGAGFCLVATFLATGLKLQKNMIGPGH